MTAFSGITILQQPVPIAPVYRPVRFKVQSMVTADELQVKAELYTRTTTTSGWVLKATKIERRYIGEDYFVFDFSQILQTLLSSDKVDSGDSYALQSPNDNSTIEYKIKFTEVYNDANGFPKEYDYVWSVAKVVVNATKQIDESSDLVPFIIQDSVSRDFSNDFSADFS